MDFREIEAITTSILEESRVFTFTGEIKPPISIDLIADRLFCLAIQPANLTMGCAGKLLLEDNIILVNSKDTLERQRFTIAHELGHFCLHKRRQVGSRAPKTYPITDSSRMETEANTFAAELLMPKRMIYEFLIGELIKATKKDLSWLLRWLDRLPTEALSLSNQLISNYTTDDTRNVNQKEDIIISIIPNLAQKFSVSKDSITWRIKNLKIFDYFLSNTVLDALS